MTRLNRAAQFAPFAALSGHEAEIAEAGRLTEQAAELMEDEIWRIDEALRWALRSGEEVELTYFVSDARKAGGACRSVRGKIRKVLQPEGVLLMEQGEEIPLERILEIGETKNQG
jgi:uncharacterized protein (UPF0248 family)